MKISWRFDALTDTQTDRSSLYQHVCLFYLGGLGLFVFYLGGLGVLDSDNRSDRGKLSETEYCITVEILSRIETAHIRFVVLYCASVQILPLLLFYVVLSVHFMV